MKKDDIEKYLQMVGEELYRQGLTYEIVLLGGAVMLLEVGNRESTQDVDTFFLPDFTAIMKAAASVAEREGLPDGWLNSAAAGFTYSFKEEPPKKLWKKFPGLHVYTASLDYILVTKIMASRSRDQSDILALAQKLQVANRHVVLTLMRKYVSDEDMSEDVMETIEDMFTP